MIRGVSQCINNQTFSLGMRHRRSLRVFSIIGRWHPNDTRGAMPISRVKGILSNIIPEHYDKLRVSGKDKGGMAMQQEKKRVLVVHSFEGHAIEYRKKRLETNHFLQERYEFKHACICSRDDYYSPTYVLNGADIFNRLRKHVLRFNPDYLLVHCGGAVARFGEEVTFALGKLKNQYAIEVAFESNSLRTEFRLHGRLQHLETHLEEAQRLADEIFRFERNGRFA
jgi:hypothetical protein